MSEELDRLILEKGPEAGREFSLTGLPLVIGRSVSADCVIDDTGVSRKHARLTQEGPGYFIEDLNSSNGTFVNEERISEPRLLDNNDRVRLGPNVELRLAMVIQEEATMIFTPPDLQAEDATDVYSPPPEVAATMIGQPPAQEPPRLTIWDADGDTTEHRLTKDEITLGRLDENDIVIDVPIVSRRQLRLRRQGDDYLLQVLSKTNPVSVNGQQVSGEQLLAAGDELLIGHKGSELAVRLRYQSEEEAVPQTMISSAPSLEAVEEQEIPTTQVMERPDFSAAAADDDGIETIIGEAQPKVSAIPPQLVITVPGKAPAVHNLTAQKIRIGRHPDNDIIIENPIVSRYHASLEKQGLDYMLVPSADVGNQLLMDGQPVMKPSPLQHGAKIRIGGYTPGEMITLVYLAPDEDSSHSAQQIIQFTENRIMSIGRDAQNDIVIQAPTVSRFHAQVEQIGQRYRVRDLRSSNGTFVNGELVEGERWVKPGDAVYIGPYRFVVGDNEFTQYDESEGGMRIEAIGLNKWVRKDLNILEDISLVFQPREFIVVVGQSGGGKSTLVDAIAGYRPATHGQVIVNDTIDVYKEFDAIRNTIGYVPQKDIIHMQLTVFQALDYAAQLRMPPDTSTEERHTRVQEVMDELDLAHRHDTEISELSGGQQKRVSIGVELLTKPGLFFLDEPTSGLDPGMETELMQLMRRMADSGRTIVLITHATKNVMLADKVVFLARGGFLTWFGPPDQALEYFDQFRSERDRRSRPMEFDDIYNLLDNPEFGNGAKWAERYKEHLAYREYIAEPLEDKTPAKSQEAEEVSSAPAQRKQVSALRQFMILSARNVKIITRDRATLALMLLAAPAMASLDFILASGVGRNPFSFLDGDFNNVIVTLIVLTNTSILVGGLSQMRELVKEREIYKRERMVNLRLLPYIMSKIWVALLLAVYQAICFTAVRYLAFDVPGGAAELLYFYITVFLLVLAGMMMGLFASALAPNANSAPMLMILFVIPQMVLSGALVPLPNVAKAPASSRWAFQTVIGLSGAGSDVARDVCWELTEDEQDLMTNAQKEEMCICMGVNALREDSCSFPGLGEFYVDAVDEEDPVKPVEPGPEPDAPQLPPEPVRPEDPNDTAAMQTYLDELTAFNDEASRLQQIYEDELAEWRAEQELYQARLISYQSELADLEVKRATAIGSAETSIRRFNDDYGWTFVDKEDDGLYRGMLVRAALAQLTIILVLFVGTIVLQKQRDVS